jgi:predicted permease
VSSYWTRALAQVAALPGVESIGLSSSMPPNDFGWSNDNFNLIDRPVPPGAEEPNAAWPVVDAGFFETLGVRVIEGRGFIPSDTGTFQATLVSRSWAEKFYPGESPIGKTMIRGGCSDGSCPFPEIVGVVDDVQFTGLGGGLDVLYAPVALMWPTTLFLFVRTSGPPDELIPAVRETLRSVDPTVPIEDVASMEDRLYDTLAQPRQWAALLGLFAATALVLAAIGVYGMLSYSVGAQRRELGLHLALGAQPHVLARSVVVSGLKLALLGSVIGLAVSIAAGRALTHQLYDVEPNDPRTLALAAFVLLTVALVACWLPARRAAAIDPLTAIRHD